MTYKLRRLANANLIPVEEQRRLGIAGRVRGGEGFIVFPSPAL